jgi:hypothetical protein
VTVAITPLIAPPPRIEPIVHALRNISNALAPVRLAALLGVLVVFASSPASAQSAWRWSKADKKQLKVLAKSATQGESFPHVVEGEHWTVRTEISVVFTAELALFMDRFFVSFGELLEGLELDPRIPLKPTVEVFSSNTSYVSAGHPAENRGYYTYKWGSAGEWTHLHLHTYAAKASEKNFAGFYRPILLHEGTHVLLRRLMGKVPNAKWFDEGVATWFQFYDLSGSVKANRKQRYRRSMFLAKGHLKRAVAKGPPKLADLIALDDDTWDPDKMGPIANEHYALAESVIDACLSNKKGAKIFKTVYGRLRAEETPHVASDDAGTLEKAWHKHLRRLVR